MNFSVLTALFLHSLGGNRTGLLGLGPCVHPAACHSWLSLWSSEERTHISLCSQTQGQRMWEAFLRVTRMSPSTPSPVTQASADNGALSVSGNLSWNPGKGPPCSS